MTMRKWVALAVLLGVVVGGLTGCTATQVRKQVTVYKDADGNITNMTIVEECIQPQSARGVKMKYLRDQ